VIHCAAQPSHDLAAQRPFDDFDVNAGGTLNLLEAVRRHTPEAVFVLLSTNKVYGDAPNELPLVELETRWDYARPEDRAGISETLRIDRSKHSIFGASKVAADVMTQEYGRYFGLRTHCLRGGCLTGPHHSAVELHGFLSYLVKTQLEGRTYRIHGHKGKQVRDNIHSTTWPRDRGHSSPRRARARSTTWAADARTRARSWRPSRASQELSGKAMRYVYEEQRADGRSRLLHLRT
jgi:CDP-paratose 2-epimerase